MVSKPSKSLFFPMPWTGFTLVLLSLLAIGFISSGFYGQHLLDTMNSCQMTYSRPKFVKIPLSQNSSFSTSFSLYIHGNIESLNRIPVLFIPGNNGSPMQIRSFASKMHNDDDTFQYFSLDFGHTKAAIHGSVVLAQAEFLNEALKEIAKLYSQQNGRKLSKDYHEIEKIFLVAHSVGGMVARTAFLLSNHPHCIVNSIIMLSTPNLRPPFSPDPSLHLLYDQVNSAWRKSFFNQSATCPIPVEGSWLHATSSSTPSSASFTEEVSVPTPITARWGLCVPCIPSTRIVSITGGELDMQVSSELTHLQIIAPRPQNTSAEFPTPKKVRDLFRPKGGWVRFGFNKIYSLVFDVSSNSSNVTTVENATNEFDEFNFNTTTSESVESVPPNPSTSNIARTIYDVTQEQWTSHMVPYAEPQHLSLRTTQLVEVGFPVDHQAMLWCKQVLSVTTKLMKRLSKIPPTHFVNMSTLVEIKSEHHADLFLNANNLTNREEVIDSIKSYCYRNQSHHVFSRISVDLERLTFSQQLNSTLLTLAVIYNTSYLVDILTCYVAISFLILATSLLFDLGDKQSHKSSFSRLQSHLQYLSPENHFFLSSFEDLLILVLPTQLYHSLQSLKYPILVAMCAIGGGSVFLTLRSHSFPELIRSYAPFGQWIISYGAALSLHIAFYFLITLWRLMVSFLVRIIWILLRYSLWCDLIRKPIRKLLKPIRDLSKEFTSLFSVETLLTIVSSSAMVVCLVMIKGSQSHSADHKNVSDILLVTSIVYVISFLQFVGVFVCGISWEYSSSSPLLTPVLAVSLPIIPLGFPSFLFSLAIVMSALTHQQTTLGDTFELFGPDLINFTLAIFFIGTSLLYLHRFPFEVKPIAFLSEIFDLVHTTRISYSKDQYYTTKYTSDSQTCVHEDGGVYAVYERHQQDVNSHSNGTVVEGSFYRVVSCNCPRDPSLKSFLDWCEWCQCEDCGGRVIPANLREGGGKGSSPRLVIMPDVTAELFLFIVVMVGVWWGSIYSYHTPFRQVHIIGGVLAAITGVRVAKIFGF